MPRNLNRDDFNQATVDSLAKRAAYQCSNPNCKAPTLQPSDANPEKFIYTGEASHITSAAPGGSRYDAALTSAERSSIENGIFLCKVCARLIDVNNGIDFSVVLLKSWKEQHEVWVKSNFNKSAGSSIVTVDGEHHAKGKGEIIGLDIQRSAFIKPGTKVTAEGEGNITATRISNIKE